MAPESSGAVHAARILRFPQLHNGPSGSIAQNGFRTTQRAQVKGLPCTRPDRTVGHSPWESALPSCIEQHCVSKTLQDSTRFHTIPGKQVHRAESSFGVVTLARAKYRILNHEFWLLISSASQSLRKMTPKPRLAPQANTPRLPTRALRNPHRHATSRIMQTLTHSAFSRYLQGQRVVTQHRWESACLLRLWESTALSRPRDRVGLSS